MLVPAILLALVAAVAVADEATLQFGFFRPVFIGAATGLIMGDAITGVIIGATMELIFASGQIGAYIPPDPVLGTIVGTAVGILSGQDAAAALTIGLPVAILGQQLKILSYLVNITFVHRAERDADRADLSKIGIYHFAGLAVQCLMLGLPVFFAVWLGIEHVARLIMMIPENLVLGLTVASKLMPAVGMAMLMNAMMNKKTWVFLLVGFIAAAYFALPTIGCALVGLVLAVIVDLIIHENKGQAASGPAQEQITEGGYDL